MIIKKLAEAARYNSGRSLLDSGDAYGRHYEKPPIEQKDDMFSIEIWGDNDFYATMETVHFLSEKCDLNEDLQKLFDETNDKYEGSWFECGEQFMIDQGYICADRDNTYNRENDLSQDFVYELWVPQDQEDCDWIYCDDAIFVVYIHTGCDIRGGYSFPVFLNSEDYNYSMPVDFTVGWGLEDATLDGEDVDGCEYSEEFSNGYSSNPTYQLNQQVDFVFAEQSANHGYVLAKLKNGVMGKFYPYSY